ncbi:MAG: helix-turn-helix domain-containing protein [Candidatus Dormibacteraceae bacterium]
MRQEQTGSTSSMVQAWELGIRLKERREQLGLTVMAAGKASNVGGTNLSTVESGKRKLTVSKLADLASFYEFTKSEMSTLNALRTGADSRDWYHDYTRIYSDEFIRYLGFEAGAEAMWNYQGDVVPGLLQTTDYARAMIQGGGPYIRPVDVEPRLESRLARQARLKDTQPLKFSAVIGQAALLQQVGGPAVMRRQLEHLADMIKDANNVELRVMPFGTGAHPLIGNSLTMLSFPSPRLPEVLWQETATAQTIVDRRSTLMEAKASFDDVAERALDYKGSLTLIRRVIKETG